MIRHGKTIWTEDDCAPDAERLPAAYKRITGKKFNQSDAVEIEDLGDGNLLKMPNGYVVWATLPGNSQIYAAP